MPDMKLDDRVRDSERRVGELEGSFQFLSKQLSGVHKSVLEFQSEMTAFRAEVNERLNVVDSKLDAMPEIVASAVASAMRS